MESTDMPSGLGPRGSAYWSSVLSTYELTDSELGLLLEACRTLDNLDALAESIATTGAMTRGSMGQPVVNPALTEARGQRLALHRLIAALALPDADGATVPTAGQTSAQTAARARWGA